jgi:hypothetical protein
MRNGGWKRLGLAEIDNMETWQTWTDPTAAEIPFDHPIRPYWGPVWWAVWEHYIEGMPYLKNNIVVSARTIVRLSDSLCI